MLVKKKDPNWFPAESPQMKVGDTLEMTDPKSLILSGAAVGIGDSGEEVSAYELYGVIIEDERKEMEEYLKYKRQRSLSRRLDEENMALQQKLKEEEAKPEAGILTQPASDAKHALKDEPKTIPTDVSDKKEGNVRHGDVTDRAKNEENTAHSSSGTDAYEAQAWATRPEEERKRLAETEKPGSKGDDQKKA